MKLISTFVYMHFGKRKQVRENVKVSEVLCGLKKNTENYDGPILYGPYTKKISPNMNVLFDKEKRNTMNKNK